MADRDGMSAEAVFHHGSEKKGKRNSTLSRMPSPTQELYEHFDQWRSLLVVSSLP